MSTAHGYTSHRSRCCGSTIASASTRTCLDKALYDEGKVAVLNGVGYPNPELLPLPSMDIWYTAEPEKMVTDGWLGKTVREMDPRPTTC